MKPTLSIEPGERVRVHRNLNADGLWVIKAHRGGKWIHCGCHAAVTLEDVTPGYYGKTPEGALARIAKRGRRDVVAWLCGTYAGVSATATGELVTYNPARRGDFHTRDGQAFTACRVARLPEGSSGFYAE